MGGTQSKGKRHSGEFVEAAIGWLGLITCCGSTQNR